MFLAVVVAQATSAATTVSAWYRLDMDERIWIDCPPIRICECERFASRVAVRLRAEMFVGRAHGERVWSGELSEVGEGSFRRVVP